jgi:hypothetical protein
VCPVFSPENRFCQMDSIPTDASQGRVDAIAGRFESLAGYFWFSAMVRKTSVASQYRHQGQSQEILETDGLAKSD